MPEVAQPEPSSEPEVEAQKPDLRLPIDAIKAASRGGTKPLIDHVRKTQGKRREAGEEPTEARPARPAGTRDRGRREMVGGAASPPVQRGRRGGKAGAGKNEAGMPVGREQRQLNRRRAGAKPSRRRRYVDADASLVRRSG